jgi:predicted ATP-grasp superfamily ATP-dependent carboligase
MKERPRGHVLIAGVTTRPLATSAARAGYRVTAIDAFGDRDLRRVAEVILARPATGQPYGPYQAATAGIGVPAKWVAYTSNFENYPEAVSRLAQGRQLLGNPAETLSRVRNPLALLQVLKRSGLPSPACRSRAPSRWLPERSWLLKPRRSGGGHGIRRWYPGQQVPRSMYLQERIIGTPGSISFTADGRAAVILGFSRQLVGEPDFGAVGYRYCGSILGAAGVRLFSRQEELLERAGEIATILAREFRLVGLNGIDFIARRGIPYPTEVNPRYSGSMELIERGQGRSLFEIHVQACHGVLPISQPNTPPVQGKAVVFARRDVRVSDLAAGLGKNWVADVPHEGERIQRGRPICTVFGEAGDPVACRRILSRRAAAVYRMVTLLSRRVA